METTVLIAALAGAIAAAVLISAGAVLGSIPTRPPLVSRPMSWPWPESDLTGDRFSEGYRLGVNAAISIVQETEFKRVPLSSTAAVDIKDELEAELKGLLLLMDELK